MDSELLTILIVKLQEIANKLEMDIEQDVIFATAVKIYLSEQEENNKDRRMQEISEEKRHGYSPKKEFTGLATEKQKAFLEKHGVEVKPTLSFKEAHDMIQTIINTMQNKSKGTSV